MAITLWTLYYGNYALIVRFRFICIIWNINYFRKIYESHINDKKAFISNTATLNLLKDTFECKKSKVYNKKILEHTHKRPNNFKYV